MLHDESSRSVTESTGAGDGRDHPPARLEQAPSTSSDAMRLAVKLAVEAGEYERAEALLTVLRRTALTAAVAPIDPGGRRQSSSGAG